MSPLPTTPSGFYSTKELARLFNADESTIKRWANGNKLKCFKTPGGHRKFSPEHVLEFIKTYHYELHPAVSRGLRRTRRQIDHHAAGTAEPAASMSPELMSALFASAAQGEQHDAAGNALTGKGLIGTLTDILERSYLGLIAPADIYDAIVAETLRRLTGRRDSGTLDRAEAARGLTAVMEAVLRFRLLTPRSLPNGKTALCTASSGGTVDDILVTAAGHMLELAGWRVIYVGFLATTDEVNAALVRFSPDLICMPRDARAAFDVRRILNGSNTAEWAMFETIPPSREEVPYGVERIDSFEQFGMKIEKHGEHSRIAE